MSKIITIQLEIEDDELQEFINNYGDLQDFVFGELCQNYGLGFLFALSINDKQNKD